MSTVANLLLENGDLEEIDLETTDYTWLELKSFAQNKKLICGGNNNDGEQCHALLNVVQHSNGSLNFSKFPSSPECHISNCSRQKVVNNHITRYSLSRYHNFLLKMISGELDFEYEETLILETPSHSNTNHKKRNFGKGSINLMNLDNLIRAISNGSINFGEKINDEIILKDCFICQMIMERSSSL